MLRVSIFLDPSPRHESITERPDFIATDTQLLLFAAMLNLIFSEYSIHHPPPPRHAVFSTLVHAFCLSLSPSVCWQSPSICMLLLSLSEPVYLSFWMPHCLLLIPILSAQSLSLNVYLFSILTVYFNNISYLVMRVPLLDLD